jgi:hypothetical protein
MPEGSYDYLENVPSWRKDVIAIEGGVLPFLAMEDPEETLMVQFTAPEVSCLTFSLTLVERLFPEIAPLAYRISHKMSELMRAQEYLSEPGSTVDGDE